MSHTPHELADEFPDKAERIHLLKISDVHFRKLFDEYHEVNRTIHRSEALVEPLDDMHEQDLRKQRVHLKDAIARLL